MKNGALDRFYMLSLRRMSQSEFANYYPSAIQNLADQTAKANGVSPDETLPIATRCFGSLLPKNKLNVPDQYLYTILVNKRPIGFLWFGIRGDRESVPEAYTWEIAIEPRSVGKGYGKQAMLALEDAVRALGIHSISLNVFAHNPRARNLYEQLGYSVISSKMLKRL